MLLKAFPALQDDDIKVVPSGVPGEDLWLSPAARALLPFTFELKNVEKLNIHEALKQAEGHADKTGFCPILMFRRNNTPMFVALRAEEFLRLIKR